MSERILVTGAAGFIGYHLCRQLCKPETGLVYGIDNFDDYYNPELKQDRLARLVSYDNFEFSWLDIRKTSAVKNLFEMQNFDYVVHLAARPGVRASAEAPTESVESNINGFLSILEAARHHRPAQLIYASSSSVYGKMDPRPTREEELTHEPESLYAATKLSNEAMAHSYSQMFDIPMTGLRFFTVYGPWGRPDMAYYLFADAIAAGRSIDIFNYGDMARDFTYIDDIVRGICRVLDDPPEEPTNRIYNLGRGKPVKLMDFVERIEAAIGREATKNFEPMPPGDVETTYADTSRFQKAFNFQPEVDLEEGINTFVEWYMNYTTATSRIAS